MECCGSGSIPQGPESSSPSSGPAPNVPCPQQQPASQANGGDRMITDATTYEPPTVIEELADATAKLEAAVASLAAGLGGTATTQTPVQAPVAPSVAASASTATGPGSGGATVPGTIVAGRSTTGATQLDPPPRAPGSPTSGIVAATAADAQLLNGALDYLRTSATGSSILSRVEAHGLRAQVLDDAQFDAMGQQGAAAFYDTASDTMYVRRTWLQQKPDRAALVIGHELVHALDDIEGLGNGWTQGRLKQLAPSGQPTAQVVGQATWESSIAREARAYVLQGQLMRELGQLDPTRMAGAVAVAANGANDRATYDDVFRLLVSSREGGYNPEGRRAQPFLM